MVDGKVVEFVSQFNFLGSVITKEGGCGVKLWIRNPALISNGKISNGEPILSKIPGPKSAGLTQELYQNY